MNELNIKRAIRTYNNIMTDLCYEHNTIGTKLSENTQNWNLRDMVAECDYVLSTFYEEGHCNESMRHSSCRESRKAWKYFIRRLKRFINNYNKYIDNMKCKEGHCSIYD